MDSARVLDVPRDRHYDADQHLWIQRSDEASAVVRVGIDAFGLDTLGELAYLSLPEAGGAIVKGESLGTLEAAKMTIHIVSPLGGTVVSRNERALRDPSIVNGDPHGEGWLVEIAASDWESDSSGWIAGDAIEGWVEAERERLREEARTDE